MTRKWSNSYRLRNHGVPQKTNSFPSKSRDRAPGRQNYTLIKGWKLVNEKGSTGFSYPRDPGSPYMSEDDWGRGVQQSPKRNARYFYRFHYHSEKVIGSLGIEDGRRLIAPLLVPRYPICFFSIEVSEKRASYPVPQRHWSQINYMQMYQHEISQHGKARLTLLLRDMGTPKRWLNWSAHPIKPAGG